MARGKGVSKKKAPRGSRKSKAEAMTGAKEAAVEVRKGELAFELVEIDGNDFQFHLKATKNAFDRFQTAKRLYDSCCKAAKKVSVEMLDAVKRAMKVERASLEDIKSELAVYGFVLKQVNHPIQLTLHDTLLGEAKETAYKRGQADVKAGRAATNPYPEGSDLAQEYLRGWEHATGERLGLSTEETDDALAGPNPEGAGEPPDEDEGDGLPTFLDRREDEAEEAHA